MSTRRDVRVKDVTTYVNRGVAPSYVDDPSGWIAFNQKCVRPDGSTDAGLGRPMADPGPSGSTATLRAGDICVNSTGRGTLGRAGFVDAETASTQALVADGHVTVLRSDPEALEPRYLWYLLANDRFYEYANTCLAVGSTNQTELGRDALRTLRVNLPSLEEQRRIVEYLDTETARIDNLISEEERLVLLLGEQREALLASVLLRGNNATASHSMPCGSRVSDHWIIVTLRQTGARVFTGPFGTAFSASEYAPGEGTPMINPTHIKDGRLFPDENCRVTESVASRLQRFRLQPGDIVMGRKGDVGRAALVHEESAGWLCGSDSLAIRPQQDRLDSAYLAWLLQLSVLRQQLMATSTGTTMANLNEGSLLRLQVPLPELSEQRQAATKAAAASRRGELLQDECQAQVRLLQEHRQALITAAVTGGLEAVGRVA